MAITRICSVEGCSNKSHSKGMCALHYQRVKNGTRLTQPKRLYRAETDEFIAKAIATEDRELCVLWPSTRSRGYPFIHRNGRGYSVTRIICEAVYGPQPPGKLHVAHSCGKGHLGCVNPHHLRWATPQENSADRVEHGTVPLGVRAHNATLNDGLVREIRRGLAQHSPVREIAAKLGVPEHSIYNVRSGLSWGWMK